jgi:alanine racemase
VARIGALAVEDEYISVMGAWTHLSSADDPDDPMLDEQVAQFDSACALLAEETGPVPLQHLANTAALISRPDLHRDLVRPGIGLYGYSPMPTTLDLRPAMTVSSRLALVKDVPAGQRIGYGHIHTTSRHTRLGLVPIGYADGLHRAASDQVSVLVRTSTGDVSAPQVGRISMDQIVVDLGPGCDARPGDEVVLFGAPDPDTAPGDPVPSTADDWADAAGTISYEVLTALSARVPRETLA